MLKAGCLHQVFGVMFDVEGGMHTSGVWFDVEGGMHTSGVWCDV